jgi:hypothetical protein
VVGDSVNISRRIQTATNPPRVRFSITNPSRPSDTYAVASLTSGTYLDGIWTVIWIVPQTITDNPWRVKTIIEWGSEYASD